MAAILAPTHRRTIGSVSEPSGSASAPRVVALAGGVGGSKLADGLQQHLGERLTVIANTADDTERHGLLVSPDHDTLMYTLAGLADTEQGWGLRGETYATFEMLGRLGEESWFRLGDRDLAVHIVRTKRLRAGERLTPVLLDLQARLGVRARILPMTDAAVRTEVRTDDGWLPFQDYFVRLHQEPPVRELRFRGIEAAAPTPEGRVALAEADAIVIGPSNPLVSIGPILAVPGIRDQIAHVRERGVPVVAVSGIVGGRAVRGPADRMLASLGHEPSALGVARLYAGTAGIFVLDHEDAALAGAIAALGMHPIVTDTLMPDAVARRRLAADVLAAVG
jgi:LPPG:FO 2-phospho-L-lactate transferase